MSNINTLHMHQPSLPSMYLHHFVSVAFFYLHTHKQFVAVVQGDIGLMYHMDQVHLDHMVQVQKDLDQEVVHCDLVVGMVQGQHCMEVVPLVDTAQIQHYLVVVGMQYVEDCREADSL